MTHLGDEFKYASVIYKVKSELSFSHNLLQKHEWDMIQKKLQGRGGDLED